MLKTRGLPKLNCPAVVNVPVPVIVIVPVKPVEPLMVEAITKLPATVNEPEPVKFPVNPVQVTDFAPVFPAEIVTVLAPELALKKTSSAVVGMAAPPVPPEVVDHLVPAVPSHAAVPPTQ
jgi:hypothetical protein